MPSVAVVVATFNGEEWIEAQLRSISSQTRLPERLIISDDGSTDGTVAVVREFARDAPFDVMLVDGPHAGPDLNFWSAAQHANTEVIAWCDQDDVWHPKKLQICEHQMAMHNVQFISHSAMVADATLAPTGQLYPNYTRTRVLEPLVGDWLWCAPGFTQYFRSELLRMARWEKRPDPDDPRGPGFDGVISLLAFTSCRRLELSDVLVSYRQHETNLAGPARTYSVPEKVKAALSIEPTAYARRAALAESYGSFVAVSDPHNIRAIEYFSEVKARCLRRASVHQSSDRLSASRKLFSQLVSGDFCRRSRGGFGALGLCRDAIALGLGEARTRRATTKH